MIAPLLYVPKSAGSLHRQATSTLVSRLLIAFFDLVEVPRAEKLLGILLFSKLAYTMSPDEVCVDIAGHGIVEVLAATRGNPAIFHNALVGLLKHCNAVYYTLHAP